MSSTAVFRWGSFGCSDRGVVRQVNEDAWLARPEIGLWAVADGMGGHQAGDLASSMVIDALREVPAPSGLAMLINEVQGRLGLVNRRLREERKKRRADVIGTTIAALLAYQWQCACLWAGDSRIYRFSSGRLERLTRDHTRVEEMLAEGQLPQKLAAEHPDAGVVTRAIGGLERLDIETRIDRIRDADIYLLCTDGLPLEVADKEISRRLSAGNLESAAKGLLDLALKRGAADNVTVVLARADRPISLRRRL